MQERVETQEAEKALLNSSSASHDDALINRIASENLLSTNSFGLAEGKADSLLSAKAPDGLLSRYGIATIQGIGYVPEGIWHSLQHNVQNPMDAAKTFGMGAGMAVVLKTVLPEGGMAGKVAGAALGLYFTYQAAEPIIDGYRKARGATTMGDLDSASRQLGDAAGTFIVDSAIAGAGYKIGAHYTGRLLSSQAMDGFADAKANFYDKLEQKALSLSDQLGMSSAGGSTRSLHLNSDLAKKFDFAPSNSLIPETAVKTAVDPKAPLEVSVLLKSQASDLKIQRTLARIAEGRQAPLNDAQIAEGFSASPEALQQVTKFASENGLQIKEANLNAGRIVLSGNTEQFSRAFNTRMTQVQMPNGFSFRAQEGGLSLPSGLNKHVSGVLGLDNRFQAHANFVKYTEPTGAGIEPRTRRGYMPNEVADAYNFPKESMGAGQSVAIIQLGGGLDRVDNAKYYQQHGLKEPKINVIEVGEARNKPGHPFDSEVMLDSQIIGVVAPDATQNIVFGQNSEKGFVDAILRATFPQKGELQNSVISISWGQYEQGWSKDGLNGMHDAFKKAALKGISIFASAGDDGALDRVNNGKFNAHYPASDPHVTSSGGTRLVLNGNGGIASEVVWNNNRRNDVGGGGISEVFPPQEFQKGFNVPGNANNGQPGRGVPDVAGNADPVTGYIIRTHGSEGLVGGTSAVAPLYAALMLRINGAMDKPFSTPLNPWLYQNSGKGFFRDITAGDNGGYKAGPGWDATTGLGSIDGSKMLDAIRANPYIRNIGNSNSSK